VKKGLIGLIAMALCSLNALGREVINFDQLFAKEKEAFQNKEYGKVFSYAQYYRQTFLRSPEEQKRYYVKEFLLVEALALSQICQFTILDQLMNEIKKVTKNVGKEQDFTEIESKVLMAKEYAVLKNPGQKKEEITLSEAVFPVKKEQVIFDPEKFRVLLEDLCQK
jgi:aldehyde:ferredoxin oxidoreductase